MQTRTYLAALAQIKQSLKAQELVELLDKVFGMRGVEPIDNGLKSDFANYLFDLHSAFVQLNSDPLRAPVVRLFNLDTLC